MTAATPDVQALVARLRAMVEERRRAGAYPAGLEHGLDDQARLMLHRRVHARRPYDVSGPLARVRASLPISAAQNPPAAGVERVAAALVQRQAQGITEQVQAFADPVSRSLAALAAAVEDLAAEVDRLRPPLQAVIRRQAVQERRTAGAE